MVFETFYRTGLQIRVVNLYLHPLFTVTEKRYSFAASWSVRLGVRTPDFHSGNTGSIPVQTTSVKFKVSDSQGLCFFKCLLLFLSCYLGCELMRFNMMNTELHTALRKLESRVDQIVVDLRRIKFNSTDSNKAEMYARRALKEAEGLRGDIEGIKRKTSRTN